jgi:hypothetical protein
VSAITPVAGNAADGMSLVNDGNVVLDLHNTNGASTARTATFHPTGTIEGQSVTVVASVAAAATDGYGPFPVDIYGTSMHIDASHAELTFVARRIPR